MQAWRIATDTLTYEADDLTGTGAKITGGRWNSAGLPVLYCANTPALACLETLVHLGTSDLPLNRYLVEVLIPDAVWNARIIQTDKTLAVGWDACPAGRVSTTVGDNWLRANKSAVLAVPSVISPEDTVILINPLHTDAKQIAAKKLRQWRYDPRLGIR